jgi:hypothetical protein
LVAAGFVGRTISEKYKGTMSVPSQDGLLVALASAATGIVALAVVRFLYMPSLPAVSNSLSLPPVGPSYLRAVRIPAFGINAISLKPTVGRESLRGVCRKYVLALRCHPNLPIKIIRINMLMPVN